MVRLELLRAAGLVLVAVLAAPTAATASPSPSPAATPAGAASAAAPRSAPVPTLLPRPSVRTTAGPSAAELNAQVARQQRMLAEQEAYLAAASATASAALEAYQAAQRRAELTRRRAEQEARILAGARRATAEARARLGAYVGSLYRTGMVGRQLHVYASLVDAQTPRQLFNGLGLASRVGGNQNNAMLALRDAEAAQQVAAAQAAEARRAQAAAQVAARAAQLAAEAVVAQAAARVLDRRIALLRTQAAAAAAAAQEQRRADLMARAMRIARERMLAPDAAIDGAFVPRPHAACTGRPTSGYENGRIPEDALCPLWGTRGQMLRADAAAAFDDMSRAYAAEFGAPICVTDSYRSYEEQEAVAREKPELAARPGTSNHGWGVATDLCDGIQSFDSATHRWMQDNSMMFGWFPPRWAQRDGSKPEPWHWEFAG